MNQRERLLGIGVAALLGYLAIQSIVKSRILEPLRAKDAELTALAQQVKDRQAALAAARDAQFDIEQWRTRSLPGNVSVAQTLYQDFLRDLLDKAGIAKPKVTPAAPIPQADHYRRLPFSISARAELGQLAHFLHSFHATGMLHQIRRLVLKPNVEEGKIQGFDVTLGIEAAALPDAKEKEKLPVPAPPPGKKPDATPLDAFALFSEKNIFQPTTLVGAAEKNKEGPAESETDERADWFITATLEQGGVSKLWLTNKKTGKRIVAAEGEPIEVSGFRGKAVRIEPSAAVLKSGDKLGSVRLGQDLSAWKEVPEAK